MTGSALDKLDAGDVTVEGVNVESVLSIPKGEKATVKLATALNPGQEYKVTVKQGDNIKDFTVKYTFDASITTTVNEDDADQQLELAVNGTSVDIDTLVNTNGWDI